jgi:ribonuclease HI
MERLGAMISSYVRDDKWSPMQMVKNGTKISHLFFADDVLLFAKASVSQARVVNEVLERFCSMSGLKISLDKSKFVTSAGVCRRRREDIAAITNIHATDRFANYLGFKMFHGRVRKQDFNDVYDRITAKLASWKSRLLNKPGRVVLANSVISSLPSYHMQINWLPQGMCDDLDRTVRRFIWKGSGDTGMHLVGWDKITQPRRFGGLGVRVARLQNASLLGKLVWEILNSPGKLWVKLLTEKYLKGRSIFNVSATGGSCVWNSLGKALHMLKDGFTFKIGDGNSSFWYEPWVVKEKLCSVVPFVAIQDTEFKINDIWFNGRWNLEKLYTSLPELVTNSILQLLPCIVNDIPDVWVWQNSSGGIYTTKDAYEWLLNPLPINNHINWKWIWQLKLPATIQFFVWQVMHGSIPTKGILNRRRVCSSNLCPRCLVLPETIEHCLFACTDAIAIWRACGLDHVLPPPIDTNLFCWCRDVGRAQGCIIFIIMWQVWCARNDVVFNNSNANVYDIVAKVTSMHNFCTTAFETDILGAGRNSEQRLVSWTHPAEGTVCLNVDGSMLGSTQKAGFGGLIRNSADTFLKGFYGVASVPSVLYAEIMAILHGLQLCWSNGYGSIVCYSDSLQAVSLIKDGVSHFHTFANEIHNIRQLLRKDWNVVIDHTLREGNTCADILAKLGASSSSSMVVLETPPPQLSLALGADARGVAYIRE